ncbi:hypothetical protein KUTeg_017774 [Tegillarca granosa]|uniref:Uncharacterized protein n=1 Tax=Tegillarca granosa TaxID=220873 RepID=A0ABQ9EFX3_TEGGR|nr:hypothetical protein KUTeg_017774 [Tegillarca granosa]
MTAKTDTDESYTHPTSSMKVKKPDRDKMSSTSGSIHPISLHTNDDHRVTTKIIKMQQEYDKRLLQYEREFDVSLSRFANREKAMKDSMLAYTERMRSIENARMNNLSPDSQSLVIRAQHIPKIPKYRQRRPASFDELTSKSKDREETRKNQPKSASRISLPSLPERISTGTTHHVKISFVSASDLYDIVDFSLRNKGTKADTMKFLEMEAENKKKQPEIYKAKYYDFSKASKNTEVKRNNFLPPIQTDKETKPEQISHPYNETDKSKDDVSKLPMESLKITRPNRAKRMKLQASDLDVIPENDSASVDLGTRKNLRVRSPPPKMSPRVLLGAKTYLATFNEPSSPPFTNEIKGGKITKKKDVESDLRNIKPGNGIKGNHSKLLKAKHKAQKHFKNLIFLRDVPERKSRI